ESASRSTRTARSSSVAKTARRSRRARRTTIRSSTPRTEASEAETARSRAGLPHLTARSGVITFRNRRGRMMPNAIAALERLTDAVGRAQALDDIFERGLECLDHALGAERAALLLFDESSTMRFVAHRGLSEVYCRAVEGHTPWGPDDSDAQPLCV